MLYPFNFAIAFNNFSIAGIDNPSASFVSKNSLVLLFPKYFSVSGPLFEIRKSYKQLNRKGEGSDKFLEQYVGIR